MYLTYAERVAALGDSSADFVYDRLPSLLRKQLAGTMTDCIGPGCKPPISARYFDSSGTPNANEVWAGIAKLMDRGVASFDLPSPRDFPYGLCMRYLTESNDINGVLSLIELGCLVMSDLATRDPIRERARRQGATMLAAEGLADINARFLQAGIGYQFESGRIMRLESDYLHTEVVKEALQLLRDPIFSKANDEFLTAHEHYRAGPSRYRDCNTAALRAMESVLKAICGAHSWSYNPGDTVERLITLVRSKGLFPDYLGAYFDQYIGIMKAALPKVRDRQGGHGAAPTDKEIPQYIAAYALHQMASNIVMLVQAHKEALG
jgi:hypothetical protein